MPTGYTADVADGTVTDFPTFALRCARQFGATIMQRDEPSENLPRLRQPAPFYREKVEEYQRLVNEIAGLTLAEAELRAKLDYEKQMEAHRASAANRDAIRARYDAMLAEVRAWQPPTPKHAELKTFMSDQLAESIRFDCHWSMPEPVRLSAQQWIDVQWSTAAQQLERYKRLEREERSRCASANAWIEALYASLDRPVPTEVVTV